MKRFFIIFIIAIFSITTLSANADVLPIREKLNNSKSTFSNRYSVVKFFTEHVGYANQKNLDKFLKLYSSHYISNDGFKHDSTTVLFKDLWEQYGNIKYNNLVNSITFNGDTAIVNVFETASATILHDAKTKGELKSFVNVIYYIRRNGKSWIITGENVLSEEINIIWGDARSVATFFEAPQFVGAGDEYSAKLYIALPKGIFAIGSITNEIVSFPQTTHKDVFKKFSSDYTLERVMTANTKNTNEYAIASIGFSNPSTGNSSTFNMNLSGFACLIRRVNVVPKNNYIKVINDKQKTKTK